MSQQAASVPMPTAQELALPRQERPRRFTLESIGVMTVLFIFVLYFLIPFFWLVISATKSQADLFGTFGLWFAPNFNLFTNLQQLFTYNNGIFGRWLLNTLDVLISSAPPSAFSLILGRDLSYEMPSKKLNQRRSTVCLCLPSRKCVGGLRSP